MCRAVPAEVLWHRLGRVVAAVTAAWWQQLGGSSLVAVTARQRWGLRWSDGATAVAVVVAVTAVVVA